MRLLNVSTLEIESGFNDAAVGLSIDAQRKLWDMATSEPSYTIPPYAILSHRWVGQEIVFSNFAGVPRTEFRQPMQDSWAAPEETVWDTSHETRASIHKIAGACAQLRQAYPTIRHIWIDTVCIDKSDGRELSSAINSMFKWYKNAVVCYVYLFDVTWNAERPAISKRQFLDSQWLTRGWTLQELLAPKQVQFFDRNWQFIGSKHDLAELLVEATGISREHLLDDFRTASSAQKMSWLSRRTTTLIEDRAYCMLGLFDVFLDTRYGQGAEEFLRLQREIFNTVPPGGLFDESLFAWKTNMIERSGLLAPAPSCFRDSGDVLFLPNLARPREGPFLRGPSMTIKATNDVDFYVPSYADVFRRVEPVMAVLTLGTVPAMTSLANAGLRRSKQEHLVNLNCWVRAPKRGFRSVRIKVVQLADHSWRRIECDKLFESSSDNLYSQADVHGQSGRVFFPHRIEYRADDKVSR